jgi:hypothetical protein
MNMAKQTNPLFEELMREKDFHSRMTNVYERAIKDAQDVAKEFGRQSTLAPATMVAAKPAKAGRTKAGKNGHAVMRGAKSQAVREYLAKHGLDSANKDVVAALKDQGVEYGLVASIKAKLNKEAGKVGKRGRPRVKKEADATATATAEPKAKKVRVKKEGENGEEARVSLPNLIPQILAKHKKNGLLLAELVEEVLKAGYQSKSKKGKDGLSLIVYQTCRNMMKAEGDNPVIVKEDNHYKLNPAA